MHPDVQGQGTAPERQGGECPGSSRQKPSESTFSELFLESNQKFTIIRTVLDEGRGLRWLSGKYKLEVDGQGKWKIKIKT